MNNSDVSPREVDEEEKKEEEKEQKARSQHEKIPSNVEKMFKKSRISKKVFFFCLSLSLFVVFSGGGFVCLSIRFSVYFHRGFLFFCLFILTPCNTSAFSDCRHVPGLAWPGPAGGLSVSISVWLSVFVCLFAYVYLTVCIFLFVCLSSCDLCPFVATLFVHLLAGNLC